MARFATDRGNPVAIIGETYELSSHASFNKSDIDFYVSRGEFSQCRSRSFLLKHARFETRSMVISEDALSNKRGGEKIFLCLIEIGELEVLQFEKNKSK